MSTPFGLGLGAVTAFGGKILDILATPGGSAALERLFVDHGITQDKLDQITDTLPDPPTEKPPKK